MTHPEFVGSRDKRTRGLDRRDWLRQATTLMAGAAASGLGRAHAQQQAEGSAYLFPGFKGLKVQTSGATINVVTGGSGPPLLLLHGAPQTHAIWHKVAPDLARAFTVVAADLRGYGDSSKPADGPNHSTYSKRAMALDQVEVMKHFGFDRFAVVGHDRGARVTHRMALDHPAIVTKAAVLDIIPTHYIYTHVTREVATAYYHWFFRYSAGSVSGNAHQQQHRVLHGWRRWRASGGVPPLVPEPRDRSCHVRGLSRRRVDRSRAR